MVDDNKDDDSDYSSSSSFLNRMRSSQHRYIEELESYVIDYNKQVVKKNSVVLESNNNDNSSDSDSETVTDEEEISIIQVPWKDQEIVGVSRLREMTDELFNNYKSWKERKRCEMES